MVRHFIYLYCFVINNDNCRNNNSNNTNNYSIIKFNIKNEKYYNSNCIAINIINRRSSYRDDGAATKGISNIGKIEKIYTWSVRDRIFRGVDKFEIFPIDQNKILL